MASKSSSVAHVATMLVIMVAICNNFQFIVADPNANDEPPNFRLKCALKCMEKCLSLPSIPEKVACSSACVKSCGQTDHYVSDEVKYCTLQCVDSSGTNFFSDAGNKLNLNTKEGFEKLAGFVHACYNKCNKKKDE